MEVWTWRLHNTTSIWDKLGSYTWSSFWAQGECCLWSLFGMKKPMHFFIRSVVVELSKILSAALNNTTLKCLIGRKFHGDDSRSKLGEIIRKVLIHIIAFTFWDFFPLFEMVGYTYRLNCMHGNFEEFDLLLQLENWRA